VNENETQPAYFDDFEITQKANPQKLTVTSWAEYYAFGKVAKASCPANGAYRYGYQGEFAEKDGETEWNSFELRQYDSEIGRWLSVDPYQQYWSPYVGMGNDPVNQIDPDGGLSGGGGGQGGDPQYTGGTLPEVTVMGYRESSFSATWNSFSNGFWSMMRAGDSYAYGNENSIFANIGRFAFDVVPAGSATNAYFGATTGKDIFGGEMGKGGVAMAGIGAVPGLGGIFKFSRIPIRPGFALGTRDYLLKFTNFTNSKNWVDLGGSPDFGVFLETDFVQFANQASHINFNLSYSGGIIKLSDLSRGADNLSNTAKELQAIIKNPEWFSKTTFYKRNSPIMRFFGEEFSPTQLR
jgi:RHS repeat-associated protein